MIPLKDNVPTQTFPIITITLILVNILIFAWSLTLSLEAERNLINRYALIPRELLLSIESRYELLPYNILTIMSSMFLHGGVFHLGGNMLYLWIFGNNVEEALGHLKYLLFYGFCGLAAALAQVSYDPGSAIPMIGASGAVSGILGAYLLLFPWAKVKTLIFIFIFITTIEIPAVLLLTLWFFMQILFSNARGVAWFAHIGGFIIGLLAIKLFGVKAGPRPRG